MAIPDFQTLILPVLQYLSRRGESRSPDIRAQLALDFGLTEQELAELIPSKRQGLFHNRVAWALSYLKQSGLIESQSRSTYRITRRGEELLANPPERITISYLMRYPEFAAYREGASGRKQQKDTPVTVTEMAVRDTRTPDELIADAHAKLNEALARELLSQMSAMDPYRFEQLVLDVLMAMGYGGEAEDAGYITKRSGDEGIDGVINQDRLGLDVVYVQAKRWTRTIGRPDIQTFVGALAGKQASKGIFITTSDFAKSAVEYANTVQQKIVLVDGDRLAQLMIEHDVGVATQDTYRVKKIDSDYFEN